MAANWRTLLAIGVLAVGVGVACDPDPEACTPETTTTIGGQDPDGSTTTTVPCPTTTLEPTITTAAPTTSIDPTTTVAPTTSTSASTTTTKPAGPIEDPAWAYKGNLSGPKVLVVGDSITSDNRNAINAALRPHYATQLIGLSGQKLAGAAYYLTPYPPTSPDVVILEFGTNDGNGILADTSGAKRDTWKATYLSYRDMFPDTCFVPVTMPASRNYPAWDASQQELNDWLMATFPDTIDWNGFELAQRAAGYTLLTEDFIHPTAAGAPALAAFYRMGIEDCLDG